MTVEMKLLIVEDDDALVRSLRDGLASQGFAADAATNAEDAARRLKIDAFDLVVLDLGLPGANGIELLRWLRARDRALPVLVLTARTRVEDRVGGLEAGADDYLTKPFAFAELVARIRALLRRGVTSAPTVLRLGDLEVDPARLEVRRGGKPVPLTVKEFAILEYLLRHAGTLVSRTMLLEHCWDSSYDGLSNLVDVHVSRLRRKLDLAIGPPSLRTVRGAGFVLEG
jgi:two-component system OmpR family response regulator